jgi:hypothetical protein
MACGVRLEGGTPPSDGQADPDAVDPDGPGDGPPLGPWGTPQLVPGAGTGEGEDDGSLSSTTNELVFSYADPTDGTKDLYYMRRTSPSEPWTAPQPLPFNVAGVSDETPRFSPDDLTLYFASARPGGLGGLDIYRVSRPSVGGTWGAPEPVPGVSTTGTDKWFMPCSTGSSYLTILGGDIGQGTLGSPPSVCAELSSPQSETGTFLSKDCLTVYFASTRSGDNRIYRSTRPSVGEPFAAPTLVDDFQLLGGDQEDPWLSLDQRTFAFVSNVRGSKDLYISTR